MADLYMAPKSVYTVLDEPRGWADGERTLVVVDDVAKMVTAAVVSLTDAHGVVGEIHIAVVA